MKRFLALGMIAVALALATRRRSGHESKHTDARGVRRLRRAGTRRRSPPLPKKAEFDATPAFIDTINADPSVQEVVHVGDIHSGSEACTVPAIRRSTTGGRGPSVRFPEAADLHAGRQRVERLQQGERTRRHGCLRQPGGPRRQSARACGQPARASEFGSLDLLREPGLDSGGSAEQSRCG